MKHFSHFIKEFINLLNDKKIIYALVNNNGEFSDLQEKNIVVYIENKRKKEISNIIDNLVKRLNLIYIYKEILCEKNTYIILNPKNLNEFLRIDIFFKELWKGLKIVDVDIILKKRINFNNVFSLPQGSEAAICLIKNILNNGKINDKYKNKIFNDIINDKENFINSLNLFRKTKLLLVNKILNRSWEDIDKIKKRLKLEIYIKNYFLPRNFCRFFSKPGKFIVLLGPDGVGKTTLSYFILSQMEKYGLKVFREHWRPNFLPKIKKTKNTDFSYFNPKINDKQPNKIIANLRLIYYSFDFILGYLFKIYPILIKSLSIFLIERYFYDQLVHPTRYGFYKSKLMKMILNLIPKPDKVFILLSKPENVYKRKQELSLMEIEKLIIEYKNLARFLQSKGIETKIIYNDEKLEDTIIDFFKNFMGV